MPHRLPNFFIVGAPKAGTTSLYYYLAQHPDIYMSPIKEPCHFSSEIRLENFSEEMQPGIESALRAQREYLQGAMSEQRFGGIGMEWDEYVRLFKNVTKETGVGEASVLYLWSKTAPQNIHEKIPNARILMILRDPVSRAFSEFRETMSAGMLQCSFSAYIQSCRRSAGKLCLFWPVLEAGLYYDGVKRYLDRFPHENVRIFLYDDYRAEPTRVLTEMFRFLGVDSGFIPDLKKRYLVPQVPRLAAITYFLKKRGMWRWLGRLTPPGLRSSVKRLASRPRDTVVMSRADHDFLLEYYRDDIQKLSGLLDRDLRAWLV